MSGNVSRGHLERVRGHVRRHHLDIRRVVRDRDRDASAPGAHVRHAHRPAGLACDFHGALHEHLGVGVGNEHRGRDREVKAHEFLVADEVSHRFAFGSPRHQIAIGRELRLRQGPVELQVEVQAAQPEGVGEQDLSVETG